jgi:hypothetical protein
VDDDEDLEGEGEDYEDEDCVKWLNADRNLKVTLPLKE